jgi:hypothetical protein
VTEIYLCNVCSCQEVLRPNGRGQATPAVPADGSVELSMMQREVLGYMRELAKDVVLPLQHAHTHHGDVGGRSEAELLGAQLAAIRARCDVMVASDVEDARYDYDQRQLHHIMGERMCKQAWVNLVWLWEYGVALDDGEEWLLSARGIAGAQRSMLEEDGAGVQKEWAPKVKATTWDFPAESVRSEDNGFTDGALSEYRLSIGHSTGGLADPSQLAKFAEPGMAEDISLVASDTLLLMLIIFEVLGDSIVSMSKPVTAPKDAAAKQAAQRPATAPPARSKKKGKKKKSGQVVEILPAAERAQMAEKERQDKVENLQRRFVELHVAEKTRSRRQQLLRLCERPRPPVSIYRSCS